MIRAFEAGRSPPEPFDTLAADLARFQADHVPGYGALCTARRVDVGAIRSAAEAPAVPTDAFKVTRVFAFGPDAAAITFRTSGTTLGTRGAHLMRDVATYDAAALACARRALALALDAPLPVLVLGPTQAESPDSSLVHMCSLLAREAGDREDASNFFLRKGSIDLGSLRSRVRSLDAGVPAVVLATSFALVHLADALGGERLTLPTGSRVMQTGGFKGRSREVPAHDLRASVASIFGVPGRAVIGEYGMTELSSQFWEMTFTDPRVRDGVYVEPPWARVVAVDPETLAPVTDGQVGLARIEDLANVDSAFAVVTRDRVRRVPGGFELLGRAPGSPPRGCSIAVDEILTGVRETS
jgi:hypothetical protein